MAELSCLGLGTLPETSKRNGHEYSTPKKQEAFGPDGSDCGQSYNEKSERISLLPSAT